MRLSPAPPVRVTVVTDARCATCLANGVHSFGCNEAESIKRNFCRYNDVAGCALVLFGDTPPGTHSTCP